MTKTRKRNDKGQFVAASPTKTISVRLPVTLIVQLDAYAQAQGTARNTIIEHIVVKLLEPEQ